MSVEPLLLALHSSSETLAVGVQPLSGAGGLQAAQLASFPLGRRLSNELLPCVEQLLPAERWPQVARLVVATGPGGFTGTRLTVVLARTLAQQLAIPLHGFSSPLLIARRLALGGGPLAGVPRFWLTQELPRRGTVASAYGPEPDALGGLAELEAGGEGLRQRLTALAGNVCVAVDAEQAPLASRASRAGLESSSATVKVGPPLSARGPTPGEATLTWPTGLHPEESLTRFSPRRSGVPEQSAAAEPLVRVSHSRPFPETRQAVSCWTGLRCGCRYSGIFQGRAPFRVSAAHWARWSRVGCRSFRRSTSPGTRLETRLWRRR